jgi:hypothetical protein
VSASGHRIAVALAAALLAAAGCRAGSDAPSRALPLPRARLVLEPPRVGVGQVATLELAVATPPGHQLRPWPAPDSAPGFWILEAEVLPVERQESRWIHRTRLRVRARDVGRFTWPGGAVDVEAPDGRVETLRFEALPIEVASLLPEYPDRFAPFGPRAPPQRARDGGASLGSALAGAIAALAAVAAVAALRRRRRASVAAPEPAPVTPPPWEEARSALAAGRALASRDPFAAAGRTARALRRYVARRFAADAAGRTSEELETMEPPFAVTTAWPDFVAMLRRLDELRFRRPEEPAVRQALAERVVAVLDEAESFVSDSIPPELRR